MFESVIMHDIEPYYNWRHLYLSEEDPKSPFYQQEHSEFEFSQTIYNFYIHPQWDNFGSRTLFCKIIFVDYDDGYAIMELIGEWNDAIENDIMTLRRNLTDSMQALGIRFFILITENVLNFHSSDDSYYEDWQEELRDLAGWVSVVNMPPSSFHDIRLAGLQRYLHFIDLPSWRNMSPELLFSTVGSTIKHRID
jgi:hypothetical protein